VEEASSRENGSEPDMSEQGAEIRASDAEREQTSSALREATVEGRLTLDEFSERYLLAQQARSRGELDAIVRDLPARSAPQRQAVPGKLSAIFSGVERSGAWRLAPRTSISAIFGSCKLDLRKATISSELIEMDVRVMFGSLDLLVPEGVDVDVEAASILSGREIKLSQTSAASDLKPLIRITGTVVCGSINVRDAPSLSDRIRESITAMLDQPRTNTQR
jgi:Domain of unknown function (DUF1707)/Cell wall-active antibiotics response 4TMS YvqF